MKTVGTSPESLQRGLRTAFLIGVALLLAGCSTEDWPVLLPDGPIAREERELLFAAVGLMLLVVLPVYILAIIVLTRYRASSNNPNYRPEWQSNRVDAIVWAGPAIIVVAIGTLVWDYTHRLDPYLAVEPDKTPLRVEAIAQDWKWLFIYPEQNVAVVNELVIPTGQPVSIRITSDTVMNSLYVAGLAGQIYAMAGMQTRLNLIANDEDTYIGRNMQYSGTGFADQQFRVKVVPPAGFESWLDIVRASPDALDGQTYAELARPSQKVPVKYYSSAEPNLFDSIIEKYSGQPAERRTAQLDAYAGEFICETPSGRGSL
ncbi:COX aromatic rich motif-containing protein [Microbaculum marinum]|uniref:Ubiquinol oxidase subunit 2 n=1 Tax=Microbaculum marinum TaxID=1764581 RepID=A0AAW9RFX7_9HYPH